MRRLKQVVAGIVNGEDRAQLLAIEIGFRQRGGEAENRFHQRTDLTAHHRHEQLGHGAPGFRHAQAHCRAGW